MKAGRPALTARAMEPNHKRDNLEYPSEPPANFIEFLRQEAIFRPEIQAVAIHAFHQHDGGSSHANQVIPAMQEKAWRTGVWLTTDEYQKRRGRQRIYVFAENLGKQTVVRDNGEWRAVRFRWPVGAVRSY